MEGGKRMRKMERGVKMDGAMEGGLENRKVEGRKKEEGEKVDEIMDTGLEIEDKNGERGGRKMREKDGCNFGKRI